MTHAARPAPERAHAEQRKVFHSGSGVLKSIMSGCLRVVFLAQRPIVERVRRVWNHASLAGRLRFHLAPSVVVMGSAEVQGTGNIQLGEDVLLYPGIYLETQERGNISIGDGAVLSRGVHLVSYSTVTIGRGTMIGEYTSVRDANHKRVEGLPLRSSGHTAEPVAIGAEVWIGRGAMILPGVTIQDGATIAANAVVTRDVSAGDVVAGVPARSIRREKDRQIFRETDPR